MPWQARRRAVETVEELGIAERARAALLQEVQARRIQLQELYPAVEVAPVPEARSAVAAPSSEVRAGVIPLHGHPQRRLSRKGGPVPGPP